MIETLAIFFAPMSVNSVLIITGIYLDPTKFDSTEYLLSTHKNTDCNQENCIYHLLLYKHGMSNTFLQSLDLQIRYQRVDCLFTCVKHYFTQIVDMKGNLMRKLMDAVDFHRQRSFIAIRRPSIFNKRLLRNKLTKNSPKNCACIGSISSRSFRQRLISVLTGPYALEFMHMLDILVDGCRTFQTNKISFAITS